MTGPAGASTQSRSIASATKPMSLSLAAYLQKILTARVYDVAEETPLDTAHNLSKRLGEQGVVQLRVFVNADGSVGKLELRRSSGHPRLDQSTMSTVQAWRFVPARQGSQAVAAWVVVPIHFTLGS